MPKTEEHEAEEQGDFRARILAVEAEAALTRVGKCVFLQFQLATYFWDIEAPCSDTNQRLKVPTEKSFDWRN